jgi:hypothetical protein
MNKVILINKPRGLYGKLLIRLHEVKRDTKIINVNNFLPYSDVREKLGRNFSIKKQEVMELLFFLRDMGLIEASQRGIKLLFEIKNDN